MMNDKSFDGTLDESTMSSGSFSFDSFSACVESNNCGYDGDGDEIHYEKRSSKHEEDPEKRPLEFLEDKDDSRSRKKGKIGPNSSSCGLAMEGDLYSVSSREAEVANDTDGSGRRKLSRDQAFQFLKGKCAFLRDPLDTNFANFVKSVQFIIVAICTNPEFGEPQPTSFACLSECARILLNISSGDWARCGVCIRALVDYLRPIAILIKEAQILVKRESPDLMSAAAIPDNRTDLCNKFAAIPANVTRAIECLKLNRVEEVRKVVKSVIQWVPEAFNLFLETEVAKDCWIWNGLYWHKVGIESLLVDLISLTVQACNRVRGVEVISMKNYNEAALRKLVRGQFIFGREFLWEELIAAKHTGFATFSWQQARSLHPGFVICQQGMLNLRSGELEPHEAGRFISFDTVINSKVFHYEPNLSTHFVSRRVQELCGDDECKYEAIKWMIGAALYGDPNLIKKFLWCWGPNDCGKSFLENVMRKGMPEYVTVGDCSTINKRPGQFTTHGSDIMALLPFRVVLYDEAHDISNTTFVKGLLSGLEMTAREIRSKQSPPIRCFATPMFFSNALPACAEESLLAKRKVIEFNQR